MKQALVQRLWEEIEAADPEWVVFDVGNVLVGWEPDLVFAELFPEAEARAAFFARVGLHEMNLAGDRGELAPRVEERAARFPDDAAAIRAWRGRWRRRWGHRNIGRPFGGSSVGGHPCPVRKTLQRAPNRREVRLGHTDIG